MPGRWLIRRRSNTYGRGLFPNCPAHAAATEAVRMAVEKLTRTAVSDLDLDKTVQDVLGYSGHGPYAGLDSLAAVERQMAAEEEFRDSPEMAAAIFHDAVAHDILAKLLGPAATATTWSPRTVWVRSLRALVNERAKHEAGCTCSGTTT